MKKLLLILSSTLLIVLIYNTGFAQANKPRTFSLNFGPEVSFPETDLRQTHLTGFGFNVKSEYTFGKHGSVIVNGGFASFEGKSPGIIVPKFARLTAVPIKTGLRYYFGNFYLQGETGLVFLNGFRNEARPLFSIGAGDKIKIGRKYLDISVRQENWLKNNNNLNMAVLRVAYEIMW